MNVLLALSLLVGQVDTAKSEKEWLVSRLMVDLNFDTHKIAEVEEKLNNLSPSQVRVLVEVYKLQKEKAELYRQQMDYNANVLAQQRLQSYKQKLVRETQYEDLVRRQQLELLKNAAKMQNYMMHNYWPNVPVYNRPYHSHSHSRIYKRHR